MIANEETKQITDEKPESEKEDNQIKDILNKSMESTDSLDNFQLRISDDESNKNGGSPNQEVSADSDVEKMEVDVPLSSKAEVFADEKDDVSLSDSIIGDEENKVETTSKEETPLTNGISTGDDEVDDDISDTTAVKSPEEAKEDVPDEKMVTNEDTQEKIDENAVSEETSDNNTSELNTDDEKSAASKSDHSSSGEVEKSTDAETPQQDSSSNDSNSVEFKADEPEKTSESKKRQAENDSDDANSSDSDSKKARLNKKLCSEREQMENVNNLAKNAKDFEEKLLNASELLKEVKMKACGLTEEEAKNASAREKRMRQNVLRVIQRDYQGMTVDDFEDTIYVAIMEYFCNYNVTAVVNRKVLMLEKLVTKLQENYHRTVKQLSEAKRLLKRMVEIRKEDMGKCTCQSKIPFKLIRSVAVQVQTTKCRGGDLCPGSDEGISFKSKPPSDINGIKPKRVEIIQDPGDNNSTSPSKLGSKMPTSPTTVQKPSVNRPISVSVPTSVRVQPPRTKPITETQNGLTKTVSPHNVRRSPAQVVVNPVKTNVVPSPSTPAKPTPAANSSIVIDLTDKEEEVAVATPTPASTPSPSKFVKPATTVQTPTTVATRVVKTSVLSPMPVLPPLPPAPLYKSLVRRPPQPVLKVCKADQSGIMLSWTLRSNMPVTNEINFYQVYACQENAGVTREWSTVGDVKALPLPMACTLSQFREGHRYHFVVRAVDKFKVLGEFSHPASILLVSKTGGTANHSVSPATSTSTRETIALRRSVT